MGIYKIVNLINGKFYIGSSNNFKRRKKEHFKCLRNNRHPNLHLQNSFNKYGQKAFRWEVVEIIEVEDQLIDREQYYLDVLKPYDKTIGYNISPFANRPFNSLHAERTHSEEWRKQHSLAMQGEKNPMFGKSLTDETKEKIKLKKSGEKNAAAKLTDEDVRKIKLLLKEGVLLLKEIAIIFKVAPRTISHIKSGYSWSHIN